MDAVTLFLCMVAFAIISMDLALSIVYGRRAHVKWTRYFIIFLSSAFGITFLMALERFSVLFVKGNSKTIIYMVIHLLTIGDGAFLLAFIPYFITMIIGHSWRQPYKGLFFSLSFLYIVFSIWNLFSPHRILLSLNLILATFVAFFSLSVLMKNRKEIVDKGVRMAMFTITIIVFSLLPVIIAVLVFPLFEMLLLPTISLSVGIAIMVYLFLSLAHSDREMDAYEKRLPLTSEMLERFHITNREFMVIQQIRAGKTNKEIASELAISANTVNNHIANIFSKTGVRSRIDLLNVLEDARSENI